MAVKFANLASSTLASSLSSTATTISVTSSSSFPALGSGDHFYASIGEGTGSEIVKVTGVSSNTFTVVRGQDGTTAQSFSAGVVIALRVVAAALDDLSAQAQAASDTESVSIAGDTMTGNLTVPSLIATNAIVDSVLAKTSSGNILFKTNSGVSIARFNNNLSTDFFGSVGINCSPSAPFEVSATGMTGVDIAHFSNSNNVVKAKFSLSSNGSGKLDLIEGNNATTISLDSTNGSLTATGAATIGSNLTVSNGELSVTRTGDNFPTIKFARTGGTTKTDQEWLFNIGSTGNLNIRSATGSPYYPIILTNSGDVNLANNTSGGAPVVNIDQSLSRTTFTGGIRVNHSENNGILVTASDTNADQGFNAMKIDYNLSGAQTATTDRTHAALFIDVDSSATGGDTSDEHRVYGIYNDTRVTGDSDLVYGTFSQARTDNFATGTVTHLRGLLGQSVAHHNAGQVNNNVGVYGYGLNQTDGTGLVTHTYGGFLHAYAGSSSSQTSDSYSACFAFMQVSAAQTSNIEQINGLRAEVQLDNDTATDHDVTINNAYVVRATFDENDVDNTYTVNNGYLFYGDYQGNTPTNAFGVFISDDVENRFAGRVRAKEFDINGVKIITNSREIQNIAGISVAGAITSTGQIKAQSDFVLADSGGTNRGFLFGTSSGVFARFNSGLSFEIQEGGSARVSIASGGAATFVSTIQGTRLGANAAPNASYAINALQNGSLTRAAYFQANGGSGTGLEINATAGTYSGDALYVRQSTVSSGGNLARFANSSGDKFTVTTAGNVGINTGDPEETLSVMGGFQVALNTSVTGRGLKVSTSNDQITDDLVTLNAQAATGVLALQANGADRLVIAANGNVNHYNTNHLFKSTTGLNLQAQITDTGIGVGVSPQAVGAGNTTAGLSLYSDGRIFASKNGNAVMSLNRNTNDGTIVEFRRAGTAVGDIESATNTNTDISIGSDNVRLLFFTGGNAIVPRAASNASADATIDLGNSGNRFKDLHMSGSAFIGATRLGAGSASSPSHSFFADSDTGMYRATTNQLGFATGGSEQVRISSGGLDLRGSSASLTIRRGNVSTGTTVKQIIFGYAGTTQFAQNIRTRHNSGAGAGNAIDFYLWDQANDVSTDHGSLRAVKIETGKGLDLVLPNGGYQINGTTVITSARNLTNIGTISSGVITATAGSDAVGINLRGRSTDSIGELNFESNTGSNLNSIQSRTTDLRIKTLTNTPLIFYTNNQKRATIDANGNFLTVKSTVGFSNVGFEARITGEAYITADDVQPLVLNRKTSDGDLAIFTKNNATIGSLGTYAGDIYIGEGDTALRFNADNDLILPFNSTTGSQATRDAAIDLGTAGGRFRAVYVSNAIRNPAGELYLISSSNVRNRGAIHTWSNAAGSLEYGRFDSSANLLVGTTDSDPSNNSANSTADNGIASLATGEFVSAAYKASANTGSVGYFNRTGTDGAVLDFRKSGSTVGTIATVSNRLAIGSNDVGLFFDSTNERFTPIHQTNLADRDAAIDLGYASSRFKDLYLSGTAYALQAILSSGNVKSDNVFQFLTTGNAAQNIRTRSVFAGTSYSDVPPAGSFNATNTYELNGTTVIDSSRNLSNISSITASGVLQVTNSSGSNGTSTSEYAVIGLSSGSAQATIGAQHNGDGYANLNLGSTVGGDRKMWHISKRVSGGSTHNRLEFFWYESGGFNSRFTFATDGKFTAHNDIQTNQAVNVISGFKVNGTTVIDSGRNLLSIGSISASTLTTSGKITVTGNEVLMNGSNERVKYAVWSNTTYGIGMTNGVSFGGIGAGSSEYAMTFQMNPTAGRGFLWLDSDDTLAQGAMALTTTGLLTVAGATRIGFGKSDTTAPASSTAMLDVNGDVRLSSITAAGNLTITGEIQSINQGTNAVKTRFISGASAGSASDGTLYVQHAKTDNVVCFYGTTGNPSFQIYGNDNGTQRLGFFHVGTDGSFNITASDTYLLLNAANYVQSNKPHNFTQGILFDGTSVINDSRQLANVTVTSAEAESGQSLNGNFGQWLSHTAYSSFNTDVDYWGWNYIVGNTGEPDSHPSSQWYRNRVSLGAGYGHGFSAGDYWLEIAHPRLSLTSGGHMYMRTCENGTAGSWYEIGANLRSTLNVGTNTSADINLGATNTNARLIIKKADNNVPDHIQIFCGSTQTGQIGSQDTTWLRINQNVAKNIYTPRYIRADSGFFVDNASTGLDASGRLRAMHGSTSSVGIGFEGDVDTGFYRPASNVIGVVAGGGERARIDSNGIELRAGKALKASRADNTRDIRLFCDNSFGTLETTNDSIRIKSASAIRFDCGGNDHRMNLDTAGNLVVQGNVTAFGSPSDIRLKENIERIADPVEKVKKLDGVTFNYKKTGARSTGLIAQQLLEVLPEVVYEETDLESGERHYALRYGQVVGLLVEAMKEQQDQIDSLKSIIEEMKNGNH